MSQNLQSKLKDIALRMDFDGGELLCRDVNCPGDWVLLTAMGKTEAGELFALGGRPGQTKLSEFPWKIQATEAPAGESETSALTQLDAKMPENAEEQLKKALTFQYAMTAATQAPSKQTATGRKGRFKDEEAAEDTREPKHTVRAWRRPAFLEKKLEGKAYGSAIHAALQYIRYENCGSVDDVEREIARLVSEGFLTEEQGSLVNCGKIAAFFTTDLGTKLRTGTAHLREFKFSILDDAAKYGENLDGELVLLQGVVDCALIEEDGITVIDFKTDYVTEDTVAAVTERYRPQVLTYGEALSRIYEKPIKAQKLYFFRLDRFVEA